MLGVVVVIIIVEGFRSLSIKRRTIDFNDFVTDHLVSSPVVTTRELGKIEIENKKTLNLRVVPLSRTESKLRAIRY